MSANFSLRTTAVAMLLALAAWTLPTEARVTRITILSTTDPDNTLAPFGDAGPLKRIKGIAFGELDPQEDVNRIIFDLKRAPKNARGNVEYQATFQIVMPSDPTKMSGLMWHDVPNRGGRITIVAAERNVGDVGLSSGWQGDNSGTTAQTLTTNDFVVVPVAHHHDGSSITGNVLGRIVNRSGPNSQPILVQNSPLPYKPATLDTTQATLTTHTHETVDGVVTVGSTIAPADWAWAECDADASLPRHAGSHADLPAQRFRPEPALPGGLHREGSVRAGCRLRRVPRRRVLLPQQRPPTISAPRIPWRIA